MEKKIISSNIKGLVIAAMLLLLDTGLQAAYHPVPDGLRYMPRLAIVFFGVLASCIIYRRQTSGALTFGELFSHGFKTTAVVAFIMAVYTFIAIKFIYPPPDAAEMAAAIKAIEAQGNTLHDEAVSQAAEAAKNRWIIYVSIAIFASLIPGLAGAVFGAALAKKNQ